MEKVLANNNFVEITLGYISQQDFKAHKLARVNTFCGGFFRIAARGATTPTFSGVSEANIFALTENISIGDIDVKVNVDVELPSTAKQMFVWGAFLNWCDNLWGASVGDAKKRAGIMLARRQLPLSVLEEYKAYFASESNKIASKTGAREITKEDIIKVSDALLKSSKLQAYVVAAHAQGEMFNVFAEKCEKAIGKLLQKKMIDPSAAAQIDKKISFLKGGAAELAALENSLRALWPVGVPMKWGYVQEDMDLFKNAVSELATWNFSTYLMQTSPFGMKMLLANGVSMLDLIKNYNPPPYGITELRFVYTLDEVADLLKTAMQKNYLVNGSLNTAEDAWQRFCDYWSVTRSAKTKGKVAVVSRAKFNSSDLLNLSGLINADLAKANKVKREDKDYKVGTTASRTI